MAYIKALRLTGGSVWIGLWFDGPTRDIDTDGARETSRQVRRSGRESMRRESEAERYRSIHKRSAAPSVAVDTCRHGSTAPTLDRIKPPLLSLTTILSIALPGYRHTYKRTREAMSARGDDFEYVLAPSMRRPTRKMHATLRSPLPRLSTSRFRIVRPSHCRC